MLAAIKSFGPLRTQRAKQCILYVACFVNETQRNYPPFTFQEKKKLHMCGAII